MCIFFSSARPKAGPGRSPLLELHIQPVVVTHSSTRASVTLHRIPLGGEEQGRQFFRLLLLSDQKRRKTASYRDVWTFEALAKCSATLSLGCLHFCTSFYPSSYILEWGPSFLSQAHRRRTVPPKMFHQIQKGFWMFLRKMCAI